MILTPATSLQAILAGAVSANQPEYVVDYIDYNPEGNPTKPAPSSGALNSANDVTILAAPRQDFIREPLRISIYNKDTASVTVTVKTDDGTERILIRTTLLTLESLHWEKGEGWYALDTNGNRKEVTASTFSSLTVTGDTTLGDAIGDTVTINAGTVSAPNIPAFLAYNSVQDDNVTGDGTNYTVICDTEVYDQGADYNNATGTFTAPVGGRYLLIAQALTAGLTTAMTIQEINLVTSNRTYGHQDNIMGSTFAQQTLKISVIADMDAGDTATFNVRYANGAKVADVFGGATPYTFFSGLMLA